MALTAGVTAGVVALLALAAGPALVGGHPYRAVPPADPGPRVPARVYPPLPGQPTAIGAPAGPASLLITGSEPFVDGSAEGYRDRPMVTGHNGSYRLVRFNNMHAPATEGARLSPDGRYVAGDYTLEGTPEAARERMSGLDPVTGRERHGTSVLDLTSGRVRTFDGGVPLAWLPDGRRLLVDTGSDGSGRLALLDLATGGIDDVFDMPSRGRPYRSYLAISPDGRRLAVQLVDSVYVVDLTGAAPAHRLTSVENRPTAGDPPTAGDHTRLAGPGAWYGNDRIALWRLDGCAERCDAAARNARRLTLGYVDADRGTEVEGPPLDALTAAGADLLGWTDDGQAVVNAYRADADLSFPTDPPWHLDDTERAATPSRLLALRPGGWSTDLVALPPGARYVQVAHDLLVAGRFGGPAPGLTARLSDWTVPRAGQLGALVALLVAAVVGWNRWSRRHPVGARRPRRG
jgi:hypothetical protein